MYPQTCIWIQLTKEWVKMEFDPSRVSLNQASDSAQSIQDAQSRWDGRLPIGRGREVRVVGSHVQRQQGVATAF